METRTVTHKFEGQMDVEANVWEKDGKRRVYFQKAGRHVGHAAKAARIGYYDLVSKSWTMDWRGAGAGDFQSEIERVFADVLELVADEPAVEAEAAEGVEAQSEIIVPETFEAATIRINIFGTSAALIVDMDAVLRAVENLPNECRIRTSAKCIFVNPADVRIAVEHINALGYATNKDEHQYSAHQS